MKEDNEHERNVRTSVLSEQDFNQTGSSTSEIEASQGARSDSMAPSESVQQPNDKDAAQLNQRPQAGQDEVEHTRPLLLAEQNQIKQANQRLLAEQDEIKQGNQRLQGEQDDAKREMLRLF